LPEVLALDDVLTQDYAAAGIPVAQVAARFDTVGFGSAPGGPGTPSNVERICVWTWMCAQTNLHPNDAGHDQIAAAFDQVIDGGQSERAAEA